VSVLMAPFLSVSLVVGGSQTQPCGFGRPAT
jgi:hypothetical protein